jgi:L-xylulokinase
MALKTPRPKRMCRGRRTLRDIFLGIDAGGTAVKANMPPFRPLPGQLEREPEALWDVVRQTIGTAITNGKIDPTRIAGVGVTGFGNGLWLVDEAGDPVHNGILASDTRATALVHQWKADGLQAAHLRLTCQSLWPGKPLPLLAWLQEKRPHLLARARTLLFCKDWIRWKLTGVKASELTDLSSGSLVSHDQRVPASAILSSFGLSHLDRLLPEIASPFAIGGYVTATAAAATGLAKGTPVAVGFSDCSALTVGTNSLREGCLTVASGTWGLNQCLLSEPIVDGSVLATVLGPRPNDLIGIAGGPNSASALEWFSTTFVASVREGHALTYDDCNRMVAATSPGSGVHFLPYLNGHAHQEACGGVFSGLSSDHSLDHAVRAVYEGVAFEHRRHIAKLLRGKPIPARINFTGGAARSLQWQKIFATVLNTTLEIPVAAEVGALGAAVGAAIAVDSYPDLETAMDGMCRPGRCVEPEEFQTKAMELAYWDHEDLREALTRIRQPMPDDPEQDRLGRSIVGRSADDMQNSCGGNRLQQ